MFLMIVGGLLLITFFGAFIAWLALLSYECNAELLNRLGTFCGLHWLRLPHCCMWVIEEGSLGLAQAIFFDVYLLFILWLCKVGEPRNAVLKFIKRALTED